MSKSRWIRLDTTWSSSAWLAALTPAARLVWVELLCYVKSHGVDGRVRAVDPGVFASKYVTGVTRDDVTTLLEAAKDDEALEIEGGNWVLTGWHKRNGDHTASQRQKRYREAKSRLSPLRESRVTDRDVTAVTPTETKTETETELPLLSPTVKTGGKQGGRKRQTRMPDDWAPTNEHVSRAKAANINLDREASKFRAHAEANDRRQANWNAAFTTWLMNAEEWGRKNGTLAPVEDEGFAEREAKRWQKLVEQSA